MYVATPCIHITNYYHTIRHENFTIIIFYGLSKLLREIKLTHFNVMQAHLVKARFTHARTRGLSAEMATISGDYFELESCVYSWAPHMQKCLDTNCE